MSGKVESHMVEELKETIKQKKPGEPVEKTLAVFCSKTGISMETCRVYYKQLVDKGEIKEK